MSDGTSLESFLVKKIVIKQGLLHDDMMAIKLHWAEAQMI